MHSKAIELERNAVWHDNCVDTDYAILRVGILCSWENRTMTKRIFVTILAVIAGIGDRSFKYSRPRFAQAIVFAALSRNIRDFEKRLVATPTLVTT